MVWSLSEDGKWRDKHGAVRCPHGKYKRYCADCGGSCMCEHRIQRRYCPRCSPTSAIQEFKRGAAKRNLVWDLSDEQAVWLTQQPCAYCGNAVSLGIDRAKNEYGYTLLNSVPCCYTCNMSKRVLTVKAFIVAVNQIARYCPDYPVFKRRWERIRKGLEKLSQGERNERAVS